MSTAIMKKTCARLSLVVLWGLSHAAFARSLEECAAIKDASARAECFQKVAQGLSVEKARADSIDRFVNRAKATLTEEFNDPESANFRRLSVTQDKAGRTLCGEVNAKNRMGGYVGYRRFIVSYSSAEDKFTGTQMENPEPRSELDRIRVDLFTSTWQTNCVLFPTIWWQ
jgi:hypothetical protein